MILLPEHDKYDIKVKIESEFGVNVTIKNHNKTTQIYHNVKSIHWQPTAPVFPHVQLHMMISKDDVSDTYISRQTDTFYWLSFEPATKFE